MENKEEPTSVLNLAEAIKTKRNEKRWTQADLAKEADLSLRTVSSIEGGSRPRRSALVKLAGALDGDLEEWLDIASKTSITSHSEFFGEMDPDAYFSGVGEKLKICSSSLLIPCYPSAPRLLEKPSIFRKWVELVENGMWVALVFPYPSPLEIDDRYKDLTIFYRSVLNPLESLARTLREMVQSEAKERVGIFLPRFSNPAPLMMPSLGLSEYRPTFIEFSYLNGDHKAEFLAWVKVAGQDKDRCIPIFPDQGATAHGALNVPAYLSWRDYLSDIIKHWEGNKGGRGWGDAMGELGNWRLKND